MYSEEGCRCPVAEDAAAVAAGMGKTGTTADAADERAQPQEDMLPSSESAAAEDSSGASFPNPFYLRGCVAASAAGAVRAEEALMMASIFESC